MAYLAGFCCKYCRRHFTSFDRFRRHTASHEKNLSHRTLQTKRRKWKSACYRHMLLIDKTMMKGISKEMMDLVRNTTDIDSSQCEVFKSQCQKKYWEFKQFLLDTVLVEIRCSSCSTYGFTNMLHILNHEQVFKHCGFCKSSFDGHADLTKHYFEREFVATSLTKELTHALCSNDSYHESLGCKVFYCCFCRFWFTEKGYDEHLKSNDHSKKCSKCQRIFIDNNGENYCKPCEKLLYRSCLQNIHYTVPSMKNDPSHHKKRKRRIFACDTCFKVCKTLCFLNWHHESHTAHQNQHFQCYNCNMKLDNKKLLVEHEVKYLHCSYCFEQFASEVELLNHRKQIVAEGIENDQLEQIKESIFAYCDVCDKECKTVCFWNWHRESHSSQQRFQCYNCNIMLPNKKWLVEHEVRYQHCSYCKQRFESKTELLNHRKQIVADGNGLMIDIPQSSATHQVNNSTDASSANVLQQMSNTVQHGIVKNRQITSHNSQAKEVVIHVKDMEKKKETVNQVTPVALHKTSATHGGCNVEVLALKNAKNSPTYQSQTGMKSGKRDVRPSSRDIGTTMTVVDSPTISNASVTEQTVDKVGGHTKSVNTSALLCEFAKETTDKPAQVVINSNALQLFHLPSMCTVANKHGCHYQCHNCRQCFGDKKQLVEHEVQARHCAYCNVSFNNIQDLINHRVTKKHTYKNVLVYPSI